MRRSLAVPIVLLELTHAVASSGASGAADVASAHGPRLTTISGRAYSPVSVSLDGRFVVEGEPSTTGKPHAGELQFSVGLWNTAEQALSRVLLEYEVTTEAGDAKKTFSIRLDPTLFPEMKRTVTFRATRFAPPGQERENFGVTPSQGSSRKQGHTARFIGSLGVHRKVDIPLAAL